MGFSLRPAASGMMAILILFSLLMLNVPAPSLAQEPTLDVEKIADQTRPSLVSISSTGREGRSQGIGTGFVVDKDGLIATNYHVIGDARPVHVEMADGRKLQVTAIHASDRKMDLAVIRVAEKDLPALSLGNPENLKKGAPIVVMGNPHGLKNSVVSGVNSSMREIDGRTMLQLAIPIEPGNSGGPIYDENGNIVGVVVSQLNKMKFAKVTGSMPENVNFGIKASTVRQFLNASGLPTKWSKRSKSMSTRELAKIAKSQTVMVVCHQ